MKQNNLLELIRESGISCLAIIGLAKNAGKTVTLNTLIREAVKVILKKRDILIINCAFYETLRMYKILQAGKRCKNGVAMV